MLNRSIFLVTGCLLWAASGLAGTGAQLTTGTVCGCPSPLKLTETPQECGTPGESSSRYIVGAANCSTPSNGAEQTCQYSCYDSAKKTWVAAGTLSCACTAN